MKYTVKSYKKWDGAPRDGKIAGSATFEEANTEPTDVFTTRELKVGETLEGEIVVSRKGRPTFQPKTGEVDTQTRILHTWAVGKAIDTAQDNTNPDEIYALAEMYQQVVKRIE